MSSATRKIPKKMRNEIAARLEEEGLDGNGRFDKPNQGYAVAVDILNEFGIEIDEVVSAWRFKERDKGTAQIYLAWTNFADLFHRKLSTIRCWCFIGINCDRELTK